MALAAQYEKSALRLLADPETKQQAFHLAGFACECALKAAIMRRERLNRWPDRRSRSDLHVHDLRRLASVLGMVIVPSDAVAASWSVVLQWQRSYMYHPNLNDIAAEQLCQAAFDQQKGVVRWITQNFL